MKVIALIGGILVVALVLAAYWIVTKIILPVLSGEEACPKCRQALLTERDDGFSECQNCHTVFDPKTGELCTPECQECGVTLTFRADGLQECGQCFKVFDRSGNLHPSESAAINYSSCCNEPTIMLADGLVECSGCCKIFDPLTGELCPLESAVRLHTN